MADVLARIVERKHAEVKKRLAGRTCAAAPTNRSLRQVLRAPGARFIMEVKRASPSGHRSAISVEEAASAYAPVSDAISVLTDGPDFGGALADIARVRRYFDGPILAKDFIVDPSQVAEARAAGADAVLVMMAVLDDDGARAALAEAERLGMDAIVEVHDEAELDRALALRPAIVGINNRDLKSLTTDLATTERLARRVPRDMLLISESGIGSRGDVERLAPLVDAFLVGSSLMASHDIAQSARALVHGRVKLCGLTYAADVALAASAGATHAGLILVPATPRAISPGAAARLAGDARAAGLKSVGVFRDSALDHLIAVAAAAAFDAVQLHGTEPDRDLAALRDALPGVEIWAASTVNGAVPPPRAADRTLFDAPKGGPAPFDWSLLAGRAELRSAFLAGAIAPANARAAARVGAFGLDVCAGVEAAPGRKDASAVAALFAALRPEARS